MLIENIRKIDNGLIEGSTYFPLFNIQIPIMSFEEEYLQYANECVSLLHNLPKDIVSKLCSSSIKFCNEVLAHYGEDVKTFSDKTYKIRIF